MFRYIIIIIYEVPTLSFPTTAEEKHYIWEREGE